jgi:hypothetical protein
MLKQVANVFAFVGGLMALAAVSTAAAQTPSADANNPHLIVYRGDKGPGLDKQIVFLAGDHEYRSEESLPMLARMLAKHYGFTCKVFITTDPATGFINPGSSHISGLEALKTADLLVIFLRFQDFPDDQMQHIVDYLNRGGPIVALRTSTHAFQIKRPDARFAKYTWNRKDDYPGGFGRQILGETWVSHYGANHKQSSRLMLQTANASPATQAILRGVKDVWVQSGGYTANPIAGSELVALGEILNGMTPDSPPAPDKKQLPVAWHRTYRSAPDNRGIVREGRVFTTTHGASEDLLNEGFRRLLVNASLWAAGLENAITPDGDVSLVGPYHPTTYAFDGHVQGLKPSDMAGWDTPIPKKK